MEIVNVALWCICILMALIVGHSAGHKRGYISGYDDGVKKTLNRLESHHDSCRARYEEARDEYIAMYYSLKAYKEELDSRYKNTNNDE